MRDTFDSLADRDKTIAHQAEEIRLLREVVEAFKDADIYKVGEIHEGIRKARSALAEFGKKA